MEVYGFLVSFVWEALGIGEDWELDTKIQKKK
jgi:hypothetical protein